MAYYHCSPTAGLTVLEPRKPESFEKPAMVYMTTLLPMALMYTVRNYEYSYGYTKEGQIYFDEYFPNALEILYRGKSASLYLCDPDSIESTRIPNEAISETAVPVICETFIPDACEALLEQERLGTLVIHRYHELTVGMLNWIRKVEADGIRKSNLLNTPGPMADYYREHYPESWAIVDAEEKALLYHVSAIPAVSKLQPLSLLHNSNQKVVYLSSNIPYVLFYIWDAEKTKYSKKWVTGWLKDGIAYYEEQFPGQLKAFYTGVRGYIYSTLRNENMEFVQQREDMLYSSAPVSVYRTKEIPDVYQELMRYEREGLFRVYRFEEAPPEKQAELIDRIASYIKMNGLHKQDNEQARFMKRYFVHAWQKATEESK